MQQSLPCVPADYWQNYMDANQTQQFIGRLVPIYQRHFTADELDGMLKFYRSSLGQKVINEMPLTMAEANQAGQQWSHERSDQMIAELKMTGKLDAGGRCPAKVAPTPAPEAEPIISEDDAKEAPAKPPVKAHTPVKKTTNKAPAKKTHTRTPAKPADKPPAKPASTTHATTPAHATSSHTTPAKPAPHPATAPSGQ